MTFLNFRGACSVINTYATYRYLYVGPTVLVRIILVQSHPTTVVILLLHTSLLFSFFLVVAIAIMVMLVWCKTSMTAMATTRMDENNNDVRINKTTTAMFEKCMLVAPCCLVVWFTVLTVRVLVQCCTSTYCSYWYSTVRVPVTKVRQW